MVLDTIPAGVSRWALPVMVVLYHALRVNGYAARFFPDKVLAEQVGCSVHTVARVRPALGDIFRWERSPGGAHKYSLSDGVARIGHGARLPSGGITFLPSRAFQAACRLGSGAAAALLGLASWTDQQGHIHESARWDGVARRARMSTAVLRRTIKTLTAEGILEEPETEPPPSAPGSVRQSFSIRLERTMLRLPRDHPWLPPAPRRREVAETASARSDPRRCGRKAGITRWRGHEPLGSSSNRS